MDGYQYEHACSKYLDESGFTDITVTPGSGDQGIDITAHKDGKKYGIQCKYYTGAVGNKAVQEAYAGAAFYSCDAAMVITNAAFTKSAAALAQKLGVELLDGIDAIALYESTKAAGGDLTDEEREKTEVERLERMVQAYYRDLRSKYPENAAKDADVLRYVKHTKSCAADLAAGFEKSSNSTYALMRSHSYRSIRDPDFVRYKNSLKSTGAHYGEAFTQMLESADRKASQYLSGGISEKSVRLLTSLMKEIRSEGELETVLNGQVLVRTRWTSKHERIVEKWTNLEKNLPSTLERQQKADEARESRYARENLNTHKKKIKQIKEQIAILQASIPAQAERITALRAQLAEAGRKEEDCSAALEQEKQQMSDELSPVQHSLSDAETELSSVVKLLSDTKAALDRRSWFAFRARRALTAKAAELEKRRGALDKKQKELLCRANTISEKHQAPLDELARTKKELVEEQAALESEISALEADIENQSSEKQPRRKRSELKRLEAMLPDLSEKVRNVHKDCLKRILQM